MLIWEGFYTEVLVRLEGLSSGVYQRRLFRYWPWRQCISPKCLMSHLYPNGPSTEYSRSVAMITYAYRVVGILRDDKQRRNRSHRKSNCKSFSLGKSRLELNIFAR